jgi:phospholipase C
MSAAAAALGVGIALSVPAAAGATQATSHHSAGSTATPIKHLVVIFQENVSFDHYFGTYPVAANTSGQPFHAAKGTPKVNNLARTPGAGGIGTLLTNNPNQDASGHQVNPRRYDPANINDVLTCDQNHDYGPEQMAFNGGQMDKFVTTVGTGSGTSATGQPCKASDVMNYYDGNTVTGLWNYAQHFAMSDNSFGTTFGPSSPGAINLVSGDTGGVGKMIRGADTNGDTVPDGQGGNTLIADAQPYYDDCSTRDAASLTGQNVGDLLNADGLSWGWFQGGFTPTVPYTGPGTPAGTYDPTNVAGRPVCGAAHPIGAAIGGIGQWGFKGDYIPHHEPFQYYASTANPHHLPPTSLSAIGTDTQTYTNGQPNFDTANHQYDISNFNALVGAIAHGYLSPDHLPAVSFLKAPGYQDGHGFYSDPIDEQQFVVNEINALQHTPDWSSTAVIIAYDDSDGWYDHVFSGIHNTSNTAQDFLTGNGLCGDTTTQPPLAKQNGRCGYGPRQPLLVISPWAKSNFVAHTLTDQSSILKFIEDNWQLPGISGSFDALAGSLNNMFNFGPSGGKNNMLFLDPVTGQPF